MLEGTYKFGTKETIYDTKFLRIKIDICKIKKSVVRYLEKLITSKILTLTEAAVLLWLAADEERRIHRSAKDMKSIVRSLIINREELKTLLPQHIGTIVIK